MSKVITIPRVVKQLLPIWSQISEMTYALKDMRLEPAGVPIFGAGTERAYEEEERQLFSKWLGSRDVHWLGGRYDWPMHRFDKQFEEDWLPPQIWLVGTLNKAALPQRDKEQRRVLTLERKRIG